MAAVPRIATGSASSCCCGRTWLHTDRPPEAGIRLTCETPCNWYEPEIRLDLASLAAEVSARSLGRLNGLQGWTMSASDIRTLEAGQYVSMSLQGRADPLVPIDLPGRSDRFYTVSRKLKIGAQHRWLSIVASRYADAMPTFVQVKIDDRSLGEFRKFTTQQCRSAIPDPDPAPDGK